MTSLKKNIKKPVCLIILDGWGQSEKKSGNAITLAKTPNMDSYKKNFPNTILDASGEAVGLPEGQMGNSEVGHLNIGAGRVIYQEFTRISKEIDNGDFFKNTVLNSAMGNVKNDSESLHLMGLVSDGGVHSHMTHLKALIDLAIQKKVKNIYIHAFLDGRDVPPRSATPYLEDLDNTLKINLQARSRLSVEGIIAWTGITDGPEPEKLIMRLSTGMEKNLILQQ